MAACLKDEEEPAEVFKEQGKELRGREPVAETT